MFGQEFLYGGECIVGVSYLEVSVWAGVPIWRLVFWQEFLYGGECIVGVSYLEVSVWAGVSIWMSLSLI